MKTFKSEQSGRSMIEMLAVLAIIGILSVAGIAGYSKAMGKYKQQKIADQISTVAANARTMYAGQGNYAGLTTAVAIPYGIIPSDMYIGASNVATTSMHALGGNFTLTALTAAAFSVGIGSGFTIRLEGLDKDSCLYLATSDWGAGTSGLAGLNVGNTAAIGAPFSGTQLPISLVNANTACACENTKLCSVSIVMI